jgi:hypothetical protein
MTKPDLLLTSLMVAVLLTAPAMARQARLDSHRLTPNVHFATNAHPADSQTGVRDHASDQLGSSDHDVWGHWGAYYGPMVVAP